MADMDRDRISKIEASISHMLSFGEVALNDILYILTKPASNRTSSSQEFQPSEIVEALNRLIREGKASVAYLRWSNASVDTYLVYKSRIN